MRYESIGVEIDEHYFALAKKAVPQLAALYPAFKGDDTVLEADYSQPATRDDQFALALAEHPGPAVPAATHGKQRNSAEHAQKKPDALAHAT